METFFAVAEALSHNFSTAVFGPLPTPSVVSETGELLVSSSWSLLSSCYLTKTTVAGSFLILLLPILTYAVSTWRFQQASFSRIGVHNALSRPPVVPYWNLFLGNFLELAWNPKGFITDIVKLAAQSPLEVGAGVGAFTVVSNPEHIKKVFRSCKQLTNKRTAVIALRSIFGASNDVAELFEEDTIELPATDATDESSLQNNSRLKEHVSGFSRYAQKYLCGPHLASISDHYFANLKRKVDSLRIEGDWVTFPDLYSFLQDTVSSSSIEALMGSKIFEINPNIVQDFWTFERGTPQFIRYFPRWLIPAQYRARGRIFDSLKKLDALASERFSRARPDDPDWEPYLGSKLLQARQEYGLYLKPIPADTRTWEKMGIMFGANANVVPSMFWYLFEVLKDENLRRRMIAEITSCVSHADLDVGRDITSLLEQPLLQSAYAETLRLRVTLAVPRLSEHGDFDLAGYKIKKNHHMVIFTWPVVQDDDAWIQTGRPAPLKPFDEFWAERFLVPKALPAESKDDSESSAAPAPYEFSLRGLGGRWIPYGGGNHLCPGRHLAKRQMIGTLAFLFLHYDVELSDPASSSKVTPDMRWFASGSVPPSGKVPFRIRRKQSLVV